ncbi:DUF4838 domain-containing protein [bacterium]|nr:MAG: DUF4838 domain-containing protein [bacterium]MCL4230685.1 DUF4838 domain-containing protein [Dehalococcoidia bacterium]
MAITAAGISGWEISSNSASPPVAHAAHELRSHLRRVGAAGSTPGVIEVRAAPGTNDAFEVAVENDRVVISGESPRGALNGAYWLLEELGFAWIEPGEGGIAFSAPAPLDSGVYSQSPAFPRRTLILGQDALHDEWQDWMEWASRNRLNDLFFHDTPPSRTGRATPRPTGAAAIAADGGGWLFERWDADGRAIAAAASRRGMSLQFGGHHLPTLLPRALFGDHPGWFPLRNGERDPRFNLCVSAPGAIGHLQEAAAAFVARFSGADIYHIWPDDIPGGGWCECSPCSALSPSDQALIATNAIAEAVARAAPGARVAYVAYHDTVTPPEFARPSANVTILWAPRERCYAHSFADPACAKNEKEYLEPFLGLLDMLGDDLSRLQVFEYYSDAILFKGLAPAHLGVLPADARGYAAAGVTNLQNLMVGDRPWLGPPWHAWWMARCAWDPTAEAKLALRRFSEAAFPGAAALMAAYYEAMETAYSSLLDLHDMALTPRRDVLDFSGVPREALRTKANEALGAAAIIDRCRALVENARSGSEEGARRLAREKTQYEIIRAVAEHLGNRTAAWDSALEGWFDEARLRLRAAEAALDAIDRWDREWNQPAYASLATPMRRAMRFHTSEVRRLIPSAPAPDPAGSPPAGQ